MKKKPKDKQAAKLKELRKNTNSQNHIALAMTKAVEFEFNRMGIDNLWDRIDSYRSQHKHEWDNRCFLPYESIRNTILKDMDITEKGVDLTNIANIVDHHVRVTGTKLNREEEIRGIWESEWTEAKYLLPLVAAWRQYKEVFKFDKDFLDNLLLDEDVVYTAGAKNILTRKELETLPFPAFYVDAYFNSPIGPVAGFFFCYNQLEGHDGDDLLTFYFVKPEGIQHSERLSSVSMLLQTSNLQQISYDLHDEESDISIWECYQRDCNAPGYEDMSPEEQQAVTADQKKSFPLLFHALQLVTYLASQYADVKENPKYKKTYKHTPIIQDKPTEIRHWDVGVRMGGVIKENRVNNEVNVDELGIASSLGSDIDLDKDTQDIKSSPKRPHSRRAHWQYYWFGKKDGSETRYRRLMFVQASFVNFKDSVELEKIPAVYHPVISF